MVESVTNRRDISVIMRKVKPKQTSPEVKFGIALSRRGITIELNAPDLPGKPDVVMRAQRTVIFVDGDFWHGGQWSRRSKTALEEQFSNTVSKDYWLRKIRRNMLRDSQVTKLLMAKGWTVLRFWESDIDKNLEACIQKTLDRDQAAPESEIGTLAPQMTVAEFFAGIGLMRMGLERGGWQVVFANDIDSHKQEMYLKQYPDSDTHFALDDVHLLPTDSVPSVTLATASFPCNDLSLAGGRSGLNGHESSAFWGFIRVLREMDNRRPPLVLLENVPGLLSSHKGEDFALTLGALNDLGYSVDSFIIDAAQFVPQSRKRMFIIGVHNSILDKKTEAGSLQPYESEIRPKPLVDFIRTHQTIRWAIRPLPLLPKRASTLETILEDIPDNASEWWGVERADYLFNQMSPAHRVRIDYMKSMNRWTYGTVFRRTRNGKSMAELRTDGLAGCLRTPRGGSGRQILVKVGFDSFHVRLLTPRECARLMGSDDYVIDVPLNQALFGFGDAVCVPVVNWIATYYLNPIINETIRNRVLKGVS